MRIKIIGVPMDLGGDRRGVDMGPSAIRYADLEERLEKIGHEVVDHGDIAVPIPEARAIKDPTAKYLPEIVRANKTLADVVAKALKDGFFPLVLGGDHSVAVGSLWGVTRVRKKVGILWMDAHADFNTPETSPSGNVHGMPLAAALGRGRDALVKNDDPASRIDPTHVVQIGIRDLDVLEKRALRNSGIHVFTMHEVDRYGMPAVIERAMAHFKGCDHIHLSFDMDVIDPDEAPGVGTPVPGGLTAREAHLALEMIAETHSIGSMDCVEVNPILDERNRTSVAACELIASALGMRILE
ncbi:MAG: arginase [Candidatus Brocadiae bacterium]|nr:arginase [Candidatus Brocadiia bacterium]